MNGSTEPISWTATKQHVLQAQLQGFWLQDTWNLSECPLANGLQNLKTIRFACLSPTLNLELKYACWQKMSEKAWSVKGGSITFIPVFVEWLNHIAPTALSLLQRGLKQWEVSLRSYLLEQGTLQEHISTYLDASQSLQQQQVEDPRLPAFRQIYRTLQAAYDDRVEYDKEIWDMRKLGLAPHGSNSTYKLNFTAITHPWLRHAAKCFLRYSVATASAESCCLRLTAVGKFAAFLNTFHPSLQPTEVKRTLVLEYLGYLSACDLALGTKQKYLHILKTFFTLCFREGWADLPEHQLFYNEDIPPRRTRHPRFIPQEILDQLHEHMEALPLPILRMVLILEECGMRISELCTLSRNCLTQDATGDWFLRYYQAKMKKEHSIPLSREVAAVIQEQQRTVQEQWGDHCVWLFPSAKGQPIKQKNFVNALNRLAYQKQIRDGTGHLYHFQSHQFRHTVGTRMINNGVPLQIVQRYLGHESLEMTRHYAEIHDQTLKEEYAKFRGRIVDVTGKVVEQVGSMDSPDMQWFKKNILAQALPNGYCALPVVAGPCPHANACLTCVHFRTDASFLSQHKAQLQETTRLIEVAQVNNWKRQEEMNQRVKANLEGMIATLEGEHHDTSTQC